MDFAVFNDSKRARIFIHFGNGDIDESDLFHLFDDRLEVLGAKIVRDEAGRSRGYGFVQFGSEHDAQAALDLDGRRAFGNCVLRVKPSTELLYMNTIKLFVGNIDYDARDADLRHLFEPFGVVDRAQVVMQSDGTEKNRGFGYVFMATAEAAKRAIAELDQVQWKGRRIRVDAAQNKPGRQPTSGRTARNE